MNKHELIENLAKEMEVRLQSPHHDFQDEATIAVDMFWPLVEAADKVDQLRPMNISVGIGPATAFRELGVVLSNLTGNSK